MPSNLSEYAEISMTMATVSMVTTDNVTANTTVGGTIDHISLDYCANMSAQGEFAISCRAKTVLSEVPKSIQVALGLIAMFSNFLCLWAISKIPGKMSVLFRIVCSLCASDILIAVSVILFVVNDIVNPLVPQNEGFSPECLSWIIKSLNSAALNMTLLNLMLMAVDHYLAIRKPLHYNSMMNAGNVNILLIVLWLVAMLCGFSDFFTAAPGGGSTDANRTFYERLNYCERVAYNAYEAEYTIFAIAFVCFFIMVFIYSRIYITIRQRNTYRRASCTSSIRYSGKCVEMTQNQKALVTALLIMGTFVLCWLPSCIYHIVLIVQANVDPQSLQHIYPVLMKMDQYLYILLLMNTICDPLIYAIRMRDVRFGCKIIYIKCCQAFRCKSGGRDEHPPFRRKSSYYTGTSLKTAFKLNNSKKKYPIVFVLKRQNEVSL